MLVRLKDYRVGVRPSLLHGNHTIHLNNVRNTYNFSGELENIETLSAPMTVSKVFFVGGDLVWGILDVLFYDNSYYTYNLDNTHMIKSGLQFYVFRVEREFETIKNLLVVL